MSSPLPYSRTELARLIFAVPSIIIEALLNNATLLTAVETAVAEAIAAGGGIGGGGGPITATQITDSTVLGRDLIKAANVNAARGVLNLNNVDNTSDANKPISTATQTALNGKAATGLYAFAENPAMLETYKFGGAGPSFVTADTDGTLPDAVAANYITPDQLAAAISPNAGVRSINYNGAIQTGNVIINSDPGGNLYAITGASTARANPITGAPLPAGAVVFWFADSQPINMAAGDKWLNNPDL